MPSFFITTNADMTTSCMGETEKKKKKKNRDNYDYRRKKKSNGLKSRVIICSSVALVSVSIPESLLDRPFATHQAGRSRGRREVRLSTDTPSRGTRKRSP